MRNKDYVKIAVKYLLRECTDELKCDYTVLYNIKALASQKDVGIDTIIAVIKSWLNSNIDITISARDKLNILLHLAEDTPIFHILYKQPDDVEVTKIHEYIIDYDLALKVYADCIKEMVCNDLVGEIHLSIATIENNQSIDYFDIRYYSQE